jgi:hypothetical protein
VSRARVAAWAAAVFAAACGSSPELHLVAAGGRVLVRDGAQVIAEYRADGPRGPAVWPLLASSGEPVTRAFPFATLDGEARDHPHHTSLWLAHGAVDGVDFWQGDGRVVAVGPTAVEPATATLRQAVEWRRKDGGVVCHEQRALRFHTGSAWRAVDVQTKLWRDDGELRFGDTKEGTFAIRLRPEFCLEGPGAAGSVSNSEGDRGGAAWGKRARWVAYQATLAGALHTVAVFDHPLNHGHPTCWHARGYGLCAANPFGLHDFLKAPAGSGDLVLAPRSELRLRYRVWVHVGGCEAPAIDAAWAAFAAGM